MGDHYRDGEALDKPGLFQLVTDEVFRDGLLEDFEREILRVTARFLKLDSEAAKEISRISKQKFRSGELGESGPLDPLRLYRRVLAFVHSDGEVDELEEQMLRGLRQVLGVSEEDLLVVPLEDRDAFRWRNGQGRREDHQQEDARWAAVAGGGRDGVMEVWSRFLDSLPPGPVEPLENALRTLERGAEHENSTAGDLAAILRLAQVSRVLRRTEWGVGGTLWYGEDRYHRVMRTLTNVLLEIQSRPFQEAIREALDLVLFGLWRDLIYAVRRREREVLLHLTPVLALGCQVAAGQEVSRLGDLVLPRLLESLEIHAEGCRAPVESLRECLVSLAPVKFSSRCPRDRILADLEVLSREVRLMQPAARAAESLDRQPFEEYFDLCRSSVEEQGLPWDAFRSGFFSVALVPEVDGLDQPVVVVVAAGNGVDAREQLKASRLELQARRSDAGFLLLALDIGPEAQSRPLLPPVPASCADLFQASLTESRGRYLVLLVDRELRPLRVYEQLGDLDVSGAWGEAYGFLGEQDSLADQAFASLLERQPWLSMAHVHRGLIAKRRGDRAQAQACFERALEVHPDLPVALTRLGVLAKQGGDEDRALELLERSLAVDPTQPDAAGTLASLHVGMCLTDGAHMGGWIQVTASLHALFGGGPDLQGLMKALKQGGIPESMFRHLGMLAVDSSLYG